MMLFFIYQFQIESPATFTSLANDPENYFSGVIQAYMTYIFDWVLGAHIEHRIRCDPKCGSVAIAQSHREECKGQEKARTHGQSRYRLWSGCQDKELAYSPSSAENCDGERVHPVIWLYLGFKHDLRHKGIRITASFLVSFNGALGAPIAKNKYIKSK